MLTIFSIPKPFVGPVTVHQHNAIQSWLRLRPRCEIILCGKDPGVAEACERYGLLHLLDIPVNAYGTPFLDHAFAQVEDLAKNRLVCYVNTDILLLSDFMTAIQRISFPGYLMAGRRWNLSLDDPLRFDDPDWEKGLRQRVHREGALQPPMGSDYFVFVKKTLGRLLPFIVGWPGWDNWLIFQARKLSLPVIDATQGCMVVHQNHDYSHVPDRMNPLDYSGPESEYNLALMGGNRTCFTLWDATYLLTADRLVPAWRPAYMRRRIRTLAALHPELRPLAEAVKKFQRKLWPQT